MDYYLGVGTEAKEPVLAMTVDAKIQGEAFRLTVLTASNMQATWLRQGSLEKVLKSNICCLLILSFILSL